MNYQKIYDALVRKRRENPLDKKTQYCESHHIIPRSLGGTDELENIVNFTAREHYVAHKILVKAYLQKYGKESEHYKKMVTALFFMTTSKRWDGKITSRMYDTIRNEFAKRQYENNVGERNPMFGRDWREGKTQEEIERHNKKSTTWFRNRNKEEQNEFRRKCSLRSSGENNPMYGKNPLSKLSEKQLEEMKKRKQQTWNNKTKEEREKYAKKLSELRANFSEEKKADIRKKKQEAWNKKSDEEKNRIINSIKQCGSSNGMYGVHRFGKSNPCYGRRYMHRGTEKKILVKPEDFQTYLDMGYQFNNPQNIKGAIDI